MTVLLHGFWGQPSDWNPVIQRLPLGQQVWAPDLYEPGELSPDKDIETWTTNFVNQIRENAEAPVQLIGYSMGARLAMNALIKSPDTFKNALLLSGAPHLHPGQSPEQRQAWEKHWALRFLKDEWAQLESDWQDQPVFEKTKSAQRRHSQTMREMLGLSLLNWSPRHHTFGTDEVKALPPTVEWAFGALDQKYVKLAKTLQELPVRGQITIIPNAGHRLTSDAVEFICDWAAED